MFLDLQRNDQIVRENVLSCIIIYIHDFLQMDPLSTPKLQKKRWTKLIVIADNYLKNIFKKFNNPRNNDLNFLQMFLMEE